MRCRVIGFREVYTSLANLGPLVRFGLRMSDSPKADHLRESTGKSYGMCAESARDLGCWGFQAGRGPGLSNERDRLKQSHKQTSFTIIIRVQETS